MGKKRRSKFQKPAASTSTFVGVEIKKELQEEEGEVSKSSSGAKSKMTTSLRLPDPAAVVVKSKIMVKEETNGKFPLN
jgi:hypothetical protein